ncbi:MAG TPA: hypothetical protein EYQ21_06925 [Flavobacteriales bacterium]|nr:hypothetical protein [Flavobacteriales bacterium]
MNRGKYPTKRQRDWLDNLIETGVPKVSKEDNAELTIVLNAADFFDKAGNRIWEANVLNDFANRFRKGWGFSDKQTALLQKLLAKKESEANGEHILVVTDEMQEELRILINLYNGYSVLWRQERPGLRAAVETVRQYLSDNGVIEQYHYDRLRKALAAKVKRLVNPRFVQNSHGFYNFDNERCLILCVADTYVTSNGSIANDWLLPSGEIKTIDQDQVGKRS